MVRGVIRYGKHESGVQTPRNPIGRLGTNGNRVRRKHVFLGYLDAGNANPGFRHPETPLVDREPMEIEPSGKEAFWREVASNINKTSHEWRPKGTLTKD